MPTIWHGYPGVSTAGGQRLGGDEAKLAESFAEFTAKRAWPDAQRDAAVGVYGQVRDQGPAAVMAPLPSAEDDAATIARANELLRTDPAKYWADAELQEAAYEALERQTGAAAAAEASPPTLPAPGAAPVTTAAPGGTPAPAPFERTADQARHDEIVAMMRDPARSREYWKSAAMQQEFRDVLTRLEPAVSAEPPGAIAADPGSAAAPPPPDATAFRA
jgi:hypothetical protein